MYPQINDKIWNIHINDKCCRIIKAIDSCKIILKAVCEFVGVYALYLLREVEWIETVGLDTGIVVSIGERSCDRANL